MFSLGGTLKNCQKNMCCRVIGLPLIHGVSKKELQLVTCGACREVMFHS